MISPLYSTKRYPVAYSGKRDSYMDKIWRCQVCDKPLMSGKQYNIIMESPANGVAYTCLSKRCIQMKIFQLIS